MKNLIILTLLALASTMVKAQTCKEIDEKLSSIQKEIFNESPSDDCKTKTTQLADLGPDSGNYHCHKLSVIETKLASLEARMANIKGLTKLREHIIKHADAIKAGELGSDFHTKYNDFHGKVELASLLQEFLKDQAKSSTDLWTKISLNQKFTLPAGDERKMEFSVLCNNKELSESFCEQWKKFGTPEQAKNIVDFVMNHEKDFKTVSPGKYLEIFKLEQKSIKDKKEVLTEISYKELLDGFDKEKFRDLKNSNPKYTASQFEFLKNLNIPLTGNYAPVIGDVKWMKDEQIYQALKDQIQQGMNSISDRQQSELKEKMNFNYSEIARVSGMSISACSKEKLLSSLAQCQSELTKVAESSSARGDIKLLAKHLAELAGDNLSVKDDIKNCLSANTKAFNDKTMFDDCGKVGIQHQGSIQTQIDFLNSIKADRLKDPNMQRKIDFKNYLVSLAHTKCNSELKVATHDGNTCAVIDKNLQTIVELTTDTGDVVMSQLFDEKNNKKTFCDDKEDINYKILYKDSCEEKIKTSSVLNTSIIDEAVLSDTEAPNTERNEQIEKNQAWGKAAQGIWDSYSKAKQQTDYLNQMRNWRPQNNYYQPNYQMPYDPFYGMSMSDQVIYRANWYGGYSNYYGVTGGSQDPRYFQDYFKITPSSYEGLDYNFGHTNSQTLDPGLSNSMFNFK